MLIPVFDPAAPSYADSSAKSAQHRHRALEAAGPREYFGASRRPPPGSRMRICTFVVSSHLAQFAFVLAAHSLSDRTEMPLGLVCVLILWVTNLTSSLKKHITVSSFYLFLGVSKLRVLARRFQKKSPRRPLIVAGHCRRLLLLLRRS